MYIRTPTNTDYYTVLKILHQYAKLIKTLEVDQMSILYWARNHFFVDGHLTTEELSNFTFIFEQKQLHQTGIKNLRVIQWAKQQLNILRECLQNSLISLCSVLF